MRIGKSKLFFVVVLRLRFFKLIFNSNLIFSFDQTKTSVISLMQLATALFHRHRNNSSTQTAVSQLLVIISDGRGIFHEGKEKVLQVDNFNPFLQCLLL